MRRLNGWQRLWIVASVLWIIWACLYISRTIPTEREQLKFWAHAMAFQVYINADKSLLDRGTSSMAIRAAHSNLTDKDFIEALPKMYPQVDFSSTLAGYKADMDSLSKYQLQGIVVIALSALAPPALVYGIGLVIGWVAAGFRRT